MWLAPLEQQGSGGRDLSCFFCLALTHLCLWMQKPTPTKLPHSRKMWFPSGYDCWIFSPSYSQKHSFITWRVHLNRPCPSLSFFLLFGGITSCLHNSFFLQDNAAICLISKAAFQPCISQWNNDYGQRCYLCWSLTFTGFTSLYILEFIQFHWMYDLYRKPKIQITTLESKLVGI